MFLGEELLVVSQALDEVSTTSVGYAPLCLFCIVPCFDVFEAGMLKLTLGRLMASVDAANISCVLV